MEPINKEYFQDKIFISDADITTVTQQITETWEKIQRQEFHTGCGKEKCNWCNFVKSNKLVTALIGPDEEVIKDTYDLPQSE